MVRTVHDSYFIETYPVDAVTKTIVKVQISLRWETERMEVESGSHQGRTILLSAHSTSTKPPTIATQLSLALQQILRFHSR